MPGNKSQNGAWTGKRRPVIGIDPGRPLAIAVHPGPHRSPTFALLGKGYPWEALLDPWLPAYLFIERPAGGDDYMRDALWRGSIDPILKELGPIDLKTQLVVCTQWRKVVLGNGHASKDKAIAFAVEHYKAFRDSGPPYDHNIAEALCIMEYGRLVVEDRLRDEDDPSLTVPLYDLRPGATRKSSKPLRWRFDREADRNGEWPLLPSIPWRAIKNADLELYSIMRTWASVYRAVTEHCEEKDRRFSTRRIARDARIRTNDVDANLYDMIKHGLAYKDGEVIVLRPALDPTEFDLRAYMRDGAMQFYGDLFGQYIDGDYNTGRLLKAWAKGTTTRLQPADWKTKARRTRHDARWGTNRCFGCGDARTR